MLGRIPEISGKIKALLYGDLYLVLIVLLVGFASFGLGRLSVEGDQKEPVRIEYPTGAETVEQSASVSQVSAAAVSRGKYVASKNGTKYHFPWCASAKRIKDENMIWFNSIDEAGQAGYSAAANCPGLE